MNFGDISNRLPYNPSDMSVQRQTFFLADIENWDIKLWINEDDQKSSYEDICTGFENKNSEHRLIIKREIKANEIITQEFH
ncbi:hypothetical protein IM793_16335 [Pedobacter sp. MR2016-19]|uniref:hypothetical protein n=1 Tax=Pedobacter sp. MR2016-19 TaxID=2780089 RepID=UPI0018757026|nr:hypothetical protein [Pedobacter sp. MR2016-19]MBE5320739.1 hypothetical protein [Pedobacter sp. MR2016-19]